MYWSNFIPCSVKLNKGGNSPPFGKQAPRWRNSSKKECAHAAKGDIRAFGVYSNNLVIRLSALFGTLDLKT